MLESVLLLFKTSRPYGWIIYSSFSLYGVFVSRAKVTPLYLLQFVLLTFPVCLFVFGINDIYDFQSDRLNSRKQLIEGIVLQPRSHAFVRRAAICAGIVLTFSSLMTLNFANIFGMFMLLFSAFMYSAPPFRLKEKPIVDSLSNAAMIFG